MADSTTPVQSSSSASAAGNVVSLPDGTEPATDNPLAPYYVGPHSSNGNEAAALGRTTYKEYLILPYGLPIPRVPLEDVGTSRAMLKFNPLYLFATYVLNKEMCSDTSNNNNVRFGLARMEAVVLGWVDNQRQIKMKPVPEDFMEQVAADCDRITELLRSARDAAWLVPFASEHIFRTKGHQFQGAMRAEYSKVCEGLFKAFLMPELSSYLPADLLYHSAFHWITPKRVWEVLLAHIESGRIPDAIKLRRYSAPAGNALITTSAALLKSIEAGGVLEKLEALKMLNNNTTTIFKLDADIRENPPKYHKNPVAYGLGYLGDEDRRNIEKAKEEAKIVSPVLQAYCDVVLRKVPLGKQKVLVKHAKDNHVVRLKARKFFQQVMRRTPRSLAEVFGIKRKRENDDPVQNEDDNLLV